MIAADVVVLAYSLDIVFVQKSVKLFGRIRPFFGYFKLAAFFELFIRFD